MIFLDSPATVGLSYTEDKDDVFRDDEQTATDSERFLRLFFTYFSEFARNDVFLSGESYAGVYIPNLALKVSEGNQRGAEPQIKLKGYLVGNGTVSCWILDDRYVPFSSFWFPFALNGLVIINCVYMCIACDPMSSLSRFLDWNTLNRVISLDPE